MILHIPQNSRVGTSPSDCLMSYPGYSGGGSHPSAEMQSVYSSAPVCWTPHTCVCVCVYIYIYIYIYSKWTNCYKSIFLKYWPIVKPKIVFSLTHVSFITKSFMDLKKIESSDKMHANIYIYRERDTVGQKLPS